MRIHRNDRNRTETVVSELTAIFAQLSHGTRLIFDRPPRVNLVDEKRVPPEVASPYRVPDQLSDLLEQVFVSFEADVRIEPAQLYDPQGRPVTDVPHQELLRMGREDTFDEFEYLVTRVVLCAEIAKPGCLGADALFLTQDDEVYGECFHFPRHYGSVSGFHRVDGWPPIRDLPVSVVWDWANQIPGFSHDAPEGVAGRALCAYGACILCEESDALSLMWGLVGLEALYNDAPEGVGYQLREKSQSLLGGRPANAKEFDRIYKVRSDFLHGRLDVPMTYLSRDYEFAERERVERAGSLPTTLLLSTLQFLAENGRYTLSFSLRLDD
jgi:hypothetical protein